MRKTVLIIVMILLLVITTAGVVNAADATANLNVSSSSVKPGDTFTIALSVNCDEGINGILGDEEDGSFTFSYDTSKLELVKREAKILTDANEGGDTIALVFLGTNEVTSGEVYEWTFKVKSDASEGNATFSTSGLVIEGLESSVTSINPLSANVNISNSGSGGNNTNDGSSNTNTNGGSSNTNTNGGSSNTNTNGGSSNTNTNGGSSNTNINGGSSNTNTNGGSSTNTNGGKSSSSSISGKTDPTTSSKIIPKAGKVAVKGSILALVLVGAFYIYKKNKELKEIK